MKSKSVSIGKPDEGGLNEDAVIARDYIIAVSDGAGGGGLFAERWSRYLLEHLPNTIIPDAEQLDAWIDEIWEPFYVQCENDAKQLGAMPLEKFYKEGSFATLAALWLTSDSESQWISFGDSVAFHYNYRTKLLEHSFGTLSDFNKPPYLINWKDEIIKVGFKKGRFSTDADSVLFVATDALAHYIMMMYEVCHKEQYAEELNKAESIHTKSSNFIKIAKSMTKIDFEKDVVAKLLNCVGHEANFRAHIESRIRKGLIAFDDYSIAMFRYKK